MWKKIYPSTVPTNPAMDFPSPVSNPVTSTKRPVTLNEIVGQDMAKQFLSMKVTAYLNSGIPANHVLLLGSKGLGKTTLSRAFANDLGSNLITMYAPAIKSARQMTELLCQIKQGDVLFIDEIHRLAPALQELLYVALEDFQYSFESAKGMMQTVTLAKFTAVAATTHQSKINQPLRDRFPNVLSLIDYSDVELANMVQKVAAKSQFHLEDEVALKIARISRRNPRIAINALQGVIELKRAKPLDSNADLVDAHLDFTNVDHVLGLDSMSRRYLCILASEDRPLGVRMIGSMFGDAQDIESTIEDVIEPFLTSEVQFYDNEGLCKGKLAKRTDSGRVITPEGRRYLRLCVEMQLAGRLVGETLDC